MSSPWRNVPAVVGTLVLLSACAEERSAVVQLETHRLQTYDPRLIEVQAMVVGPQKGLHYKWFSVNGDFDPQQSYEPKTQFTFAPYALRDRIWVEVWRDSTKVTESALDVDVEGHPRPRPRPSTGKEGVPELSITRIPRYQAEGGPDTRDTIGGTVRIPDVDDYRVIVYARADAWYIQPTPFAMQPIEDDYSWLTWTHTGSSYAALVVRKGYKPMTRLDVLPQIDPDVLARSIVEGRR